MNTFLMIIVAIFWIVVIYYFLKIILGYIGAAIVGAVFFGIIGAIVGYFLFPSYIIDIILYSSGTGAVIGFVLGILSTFDLLKSPFASKIAKEVMDGRTPDKNQCVIIDEYGHKKIVKKTGRGVLGETYLEDKDGNTMVKDTFSNDVHYT